jgi:hypothetical protein
MLTWDFQSLSSLWISGVTGGGGGWGGEEEKIFEPYSLKKGVQKNFPHYDN